MNRTNHMILKTLRLVAALSCLASAGCQTMHSQQSASTAPPIFTGMPRELSKVVLPEYVIEPPDILSIEVVNAVPKSPYRLKTLDVLSIQVLGTLPDSPITGTFPIEPGGVVNLGVPYGTVNVAGLTTSDAEIAIRERLLKFLQAPEVAVALAQLGASQQIRGEYLVGPDGTVTLGSYGNVSLVGQTLQQAKVYLENHLSRYLEEPNVSINVLGYNSKVYYIIIQGAGVGDGVFRVPVTGNETVLDAIANINGLEPVSSKRIWIARPTDMAGHPQILPVDWHGVTEMASPLSNYQIMPGDRVFIQEDKLVAFDNGLAKLIAPMERIMGFTLLGTGTVTRLSGAVLRGGGNPRSFSGF